MIKILTYAIFCLILISCRTEHVLLDCHEGIVVDKFSNESISGVLVYTDSTAYDRFEPVVTKQDGYFYTPGLVIPYYDKGYIWRRRMSYTLIFHSEGYLSDTVYLSSNNEVLDTIDLGKIYLTPISE